MLIPLDFQLEIKGIVSQSKGYFSKLVSHLTWPHPLDWNPALSFQSVAVVCGYRKEI